MQSDTQNKKTLSAADLAQFTGTEQWFRHSINRSILYTEGAQHVAEHGGAYWLLDEIALIQPYDKNVAAEEFQVWTLTVRPDKTATLTCDDGNACANSAKIWLATSKAVAPWRSHVMARH